MKLAIGFFDGIHRGHRRILEGADATFTFRNHPLSVLHPEKMPMLLMSEEERIAGLPNVHAEEFTATTAATTAEEFAARLRREYPGLEAVRCGANWRFGAGGRGSPEMLREMGINVEVEGYAEYDGATISSTRIREALAAGKIEDANAMLGRKWSITGEVVGGKGEGRKLGFPTINLRIGRRIDLPFGVYAADTRFGRAVVNWGLAPTMGEKAWKKPVMEVHVIGQGNANTETWSNGVAGCMETLEMAAFLRPERKFANAEELKKQILCDLPLALERNK